MSKPVTWKELDLTRQEEPMAEDKKVTITFTLPWTADVAKVDESTVALLIRDALHEFHVGQRRDAEAYVAKRYANSSMFSESWKAEKVKDVQNRVKLAKGLCLESVKVEETHHTHPGVEGACQCAYPDQHPLPEVQNQ